MPWPLNPRDAVIRGVGSDLLDLDGSLVVTASSCSHPQDTPIEDVERANLVRCIHQLVPLGPVRHLLQPHRPNTVKHCV